MPHGRKTIERRHAHRVVRALGARTLGVYCTPSAVQDAMTQASATRPLAWADQVGRADIQAVVSPMLSHANAFHGEDLDRVYPLIQRQVLPGKNMHG